MAYRFLRCIAVMTLLAAPARAMDPAPLIEAARGADYVIVGERHDNAAHHAMQVAIVEALQPDALAFEMLPRSVEARVNALRAQGLDGLAIGEAIGWGELGWSNWRDYAPILDAAPDAHVIGGGLSRQTLMAVRGGDLSALGLDEAYGLSSPLDPELQAEMLAEQVTAHCDMMPAEALGGMVLVQRAWDAAYAEALRRGRAITGGQVVLIAGNGHARRDRGAPAALRRVEPDADVIAIGLLEPGDGPQPFDATVTAPPPPDRGDPCAVFRR